MEEAAALQEAVVTMLDYLLRMEVVQEQEDLLTIPTPDTTHLRVKAGLQAVTEDLVVVLAVSIIKDFPD